YHELRTIFQTVELADTLDVEVARAIYGSPAVELEVVGAALGAGPDNLAHRAATGFLARWAPATRARIRLEKRIPMGGGLGGGSSNAAAVLRALQALLGAPAPGGELWELARSLGADVPYFLVGGTALGVGRGDEIVPLPELPERDLLLVLPPVHVPTAVVFGALDPPRGDSNAELTVGHLDARINHLVQRGNLGWEAFAHAVNDLEGPVFRRWPELATLHAELVSAGAVTRLSGSGAAMWALFDGGEAPGIERRMPSGVRLVRARTLSRDAIAGGR